MAGFTLLELMLVIALIGLIGALGLAWLGGDSSRLFEARLAQLQQRFQLAAEQALHRGQVIGWRFDGGGYRFERLLPDASGAVLQWVPLGRQGPGDSADWPPELQLLSASGKPVAGSASKPLANAKAGTALPQRIWLPDGEIAGEPLHWRWPDGQLRIALQPQAAP